MALFNRWRGPRKARLSPEISREPFANAHGAATRGANRKSGHRRRTFRPLRLGILLALFLILVWTISDWRGRTKERVSLKPSGASQRAEQRRKASQVRANSSTFLPSEDPRPVHHDPNLVIYSNHPLSRHRPPPNQFLLSPAARFDAPVVGIITATNNPRPEIFRDTAASLYAQSLQNWVWVIVDDHTDRPESQQVLTSVAADPRVRLLKNPGAQGLAASRNVGLKYLTDGETVPKYLVSLDDDDMFEFTALEKTAWMLESNPNWEIGGFYYVKHGPGANETIFTGLHSLSENFYEGNFVPNAAMFRTLSVIEADCSYDETSFGRGGEDWDLWMCLAEADMWGGTALEPLFWYRVNEPQYRAKRWAETFSTDRAFLALREHIQSKHSSLYDPGRFPRRRPKRSKQLESIAWDEPFESNLAATDRSIMFIVPWLYLGGADIGALRMIQLYAEHGYRVTVVCTLFDPPAGIELRPEVLQWTHDVHILPSFLRACDFPRYLKHLVESRGTRQVILSNSQLTYEMLPALVEQVPDVQFIDYLHNEAYDGWKSGGYPQYASIMRRYVARTITCSFYLRDYLIKRGHNPDRVGVVKLGIEMDRFHPVTSRERNNAKATFLHVESKTIVITVVARLDPQKRPLLIPRIVTHLLDLVKEDFLVLMIGDGEKAKALEAEIERRTVGDYVRVLGSLKDPYPYLGASDIFLLPSRSEGISIAIAEAMAMGLPIVTARAGALPEQLGETSDGSDKVLGGILVDHALQDDADALLYAKALASLIQDASLRRQLGANARNLVETGMEWRRSLSKLFDEVALAKNFPRVEMDLENPHPAAYLAIQTLLLENNEMTDFSGKYPPPPEVPVHSAYDSYHGSEEKDDDDVWPSLSDLDLVSEDEMIHMGPKEKVDGVNSDPAWRSDERKVADSEVDDKQHEPMMGVGQAEGVTVRNSKPQKKQRIAKEASGPEAVVER